MLTRPAGHWWRVSFQGPRRQLDFGLWRPVLEKLGWETLWPCGRITLRRPASGRTGEAWIEFSRSDRFDLVERTQERGLTLEPPASTPEKLEKDRDVPSTSRDEGRKMESRPGARRGDDGAADRRLVLRRAARDPDRLRRRPEGVGLRDQQMYEEALEQACWQFNGTGDGGLTRAHHARSGRDVWVKVRGGNGELFFTIADLGAEAAPDKLKAAIEKQGHVAVYGIDFGLDKDVLRPGSEATLQQILMLLQGTSSLRLEIQGHTDGSGNRPHNQSLSEARAASVRKWLVEHSIDASRLATARYADTQPVADNATPAGRALNRRVELVRAR